MTEDESTKAAVLAEWMLADDPTDATEFMGIDVLPVARALSASQARVKELEAANAWRGIESAPKDGTP